MRMLNWALRALVFLLLFGFAARNTETVSLRFFFDVVWQAPMILILFAFFAGGVLFALLAVSGGFLRLRRELSRLRKDASRAAVAERQP